MKEEWKIIETHPNYEVSNFGRVRNRITGRIKAQSLTESRHGLKYKDVELWKDGKRSHARVHRLVAQSFIPNPKNKPEVNHFDCNSLHNHYTNLEWVTRQENEMHKKFMEGYIDPEDVLCYRECFNVQCPFHIKTEPYGYCSLRQHKEQEGKMHEQQTVSNQRWPGGATETTKAASGTQHPIILT